MVNSWKTIEENNSLWEGLFSIIIIVEPKLKNIVGKMGVFLLMPPPPLAHLFVG
jgi:hypothetical protein